MNGLARCPRTASQVPNLLLSLLTPYETAVPPGSFRHLVAKYSPRYRLSFTLLNEDAAAGRAVVGWDVAKMISRRFIPVTLRKEGLNLKCRLDRTYPGTDFGAPQLHHREPDPIPRTPSVRTADPR
jgi:hypothetical protein